MSLQDLHGLVEEDFNIVLLLHMLHLDLRAILLNAQSTIPGQWKCA